MPLSLEPLGRAEGERACGAVKNTDSSLTVGQCYVAYRGSCKGPAARVSAGSHLNGPCTRRQPVEEEAPCSKRLWAVALA